ncbi:MAG: OmpA family protein [Desulfobacteraceae bacterium]|nr:OmpA family protein [Desulfobacteraceae bacterium]
MKKTIIVSILSVILAAAIVFNFLLYKKLTDSRKTVQEYREEIRTLESKVEGKQKTLEKLEEKAAENRSLESKLHTVEDQVRTLKTRVAELLDQKDKQQKKYEATIKELKASLASREERVSSLQKDLQESEEARKNLETTIEGQKRSIGELEDRIADLQAQNKSLEKELAQYRQKESTYTQRIQELSNKLERQQEREQKEEAALMSNIQELKESEQSLEDKIEAREDSISKLEKQVQHTKQEKQIIKEELKENKDLLKGLQERIARVRQERESMQKELEQLRSTFKTLVADLKEKVEQKGVTIEKLRGELSVTLVDKVLFDSGEATIRPEGREVLQSLADVLMKEEQKSIRVVGHTDNVPIGPQLKDKFPTNWELSVARATRVVRVLDRFLDPDRMEAVGCSFYDPVASNDTEEGRAKNRRVEIMIAPRLIDYQAQKADTEPGS